MTQNDRANTEAHSELAQEAQSEAPSVETLEEILMQVNCWCLHDRGCTITEEQQKAIAKINRLISGAYNKGYSDGRLVKPKYKVGDIAGNYQITERFRRVGKNTKYKVVCILCGAPMFRYSNKFNLKHKECGAI